MKQMNILITGLGLFSCALAHPTAMEERAAAQTVHLTFHGGPASYNMAFPADGKTYKTNSNIAVSIIDANDYNADTQCTFTTASQSTKVLSIDSKGGQHLLVGPPQAISAVSCSGICVSNYGRCYDTNGQFVASCCNGYCAANLCRPWNGV